jgi:hypothetical protein
MIVLSAGCIEYVNECGNARLFTRPEKPLPPLELRIQRRPPHGWLAVQMGSTHLVLPTMGFAQGEVWNGTIRLLVKAAESATVA